MTTYFEASDAHGEPTLWAVEGNRHAVPAMRQSDVSRAFWPDVVARMTGTVLINDAPTVERIAQAVCRSENSGELTNWDTYRDLWMHHARAILAALTGVPHD